MGVGAPRSLLPAGAHLGLRLPVLVPGNDKAGKAMLNVFCFPEVAYSSSFSALSSQIHLAMIS